VISIEALRSAPLIMIFEVSAFANNSAGIASRRRMTVTESSRFTVHPTYCSKLDHRGLGRSIRWTGSMAMKPAAKLEEEKNGSGKKSCVAT
jgi:hypothetical protein